MTDSEHQQHYHLARKQLERVQGAWDKPTDWSDLLIYGFYCLENAVMAAALCQGWEIKHSHPSKVDASKRLAQETGLPEISDLLKTLNTARKAEAYGDMPAPALDPEDLASEIEEYVVAVGDLIGEKPW